MLPTLPTWTAEASIYQRSRYSYCAPLTGLSLAWTQSRGQPGHVLPFSPLPCGTCGPCVQDETSFTGCTEICWTRRPPGGTCDEYDRPCRGCTITCPTGFTRCGTGCVDLANDAANCGSCRNACAANEVCQGGRCVCAPPSSLCGGACCAPGSVCCGGACCAPGSVCCGGACCAPGSMCCGVPGVCGSPCPDGIHCCPSGKCTADSTGCCTGVLCPDGITCCQHGCISWPWGGQGCY
jgi:hypothetical protein